MRRGMHHQAPAQGMTHQHHGAITGLLASCLGQPTAVAGQAGLQAPRPLRTTEARQVWRPALPIGAERFGEGLPQTA